METWFWPLAILVAIAVVVTYAWLEISRSTRGNVARHFVCPEVRRDVMVTFRSDFLDPDYYEDVVRCSEFGSAEPVVCDRACLGLSKDELRWAERRTARLEERVAS
jgi:hypothetical protein